MNPIYPNTHYHHRMPPTLETHKIVFQEQGFTKLTPLIDFINFDELFEETYGLLQYKFRCDQKLEETAFSPRILYRVKQSTIKTHSRLIPALYESIELRSLIEQLCGEPIYSLPFEEEQYLINCICEKGDTDGWHWNDYSYSIVFILKAPKLENGGLVQCVPHTPWINTKDSINKTLCDNQVSTYFFHDKEAYLLKSHTTMHRVTPLTNQDFRLSIHMSWANATDLNRKIDRSTLQKLYK